MHTEPIAYVVGDSTVLIDDIIDGLADEHRVYIIRIARNGITTVYRCKVLLAEILQLNDQQLAEHLVHRYHRRVRHFAFKGEAIP